MAIHGNSNRDRRILSTIPPPVQRGDRLAASWLNQLRESIGTRQLESNPLPFKDLGPDQFNFELFDDESSFSIREGRWTRNGITLFLATTSLTLATDDVNTVFLTLDDNVAPTTITLGTNTTGLPAEAPGENRQWLIGTVTTDADDNVIDHFNDWQGGDIDNLSTVLALIPDHDSPNSGTDPYRSTLEKNPDSGDHKDELQMFNVKGVAEDGSVFADGRPHCFPLYKATDPDSRGELIWIPADSDAHDNLGFNSVQRSLGIVAGSRTKAINGTVNAAGGTLADFWLQLYNWDSSGGFTLDRDTDHILCRDDDDGIGNKKVLSYATPAQIGNSILPGDLNGGGGIGIGDINDVNNGTIIHGNLGFGSGPHPLDTEANSDRSQDGRYWYADGVSDEDGGAGGGVSGRDYSTSGVVAALSFSIQNVPLTNFWDSEDMVSTPNNDRILSVGNDYQLSVAGNHTIDGFLTLNVGTLHHGHMTDRLTNIPAVGGGLNNLLAAFNTLTSDLQSIGWMS